MSTTTLTVSPASPSGETGLPRPDDDEIIIECRSIATNQPSIVANPCGSGIFPELSLAPIVGEDMAGVVVALGAEVTRFKVGDRVTAFAQRSCHRYFVVCDHMASHIPPSLSFEQAAQLPMAFTTALTGLFHKDYLALRKPLLETRPPEGRAVFITGGSTAIGSNAVQLAVAAGYEVFATCSKQESEYIKRLGASQVFDSQSSWLRQDVAAAFRGKTGVGALAVADPTSGSPQAVVEVCAAALSSCKGSKFIALTFQAPRRLPPGVRTNTVRPVNLHRERALGNAIFHGYLSQALAAGAIQPVTLHGK